MSLAITVLAATGQTGRELVQQALARGHAVTAVARNPSRLGDLPLDRLRASDLRLDGVRGDSSGLDAPERDGPDLDGPERDGPQLRLVAADVRDQDSMARALAGADVIVSGLGAVGGEPPGVLTAGARAVVAALAAGSSSGTRIVWLGAFGTGPSAAAAGRLTSTMLKAMGDRLTDKVTADAAILAAGGTVFHAGPLTLAPLSPDRRTVPLAAAPHRLFPARVSRATVAAAMLDEAENPRYASRTALVLTR